MEEREFENLSRYVDEDLPVTERQALEDEIRHRPDLQMALKDLVAIRGTVRRLAEQQNPPDALDDLVQPLRRSGRPSLRQSNILPLAAVAASILLLAFLGFEIGHRGRLPDADDSDHTSAREVFALKALPEADEESLVGAIEHLMAMPYPAPTLVEPEALIAIGPLPDPPEQLRGELALAVGHYRIPLASADYPLGLELELSVEQGRIVGCRSANEDDDDVRALCSVLTATSWVGIKDGDHRAMVVTAR